MAYKIEYNAILVSSTTADLADEVFAENYLAYDTKTDSLKKGDGKTKFSELPIISSGAKGDAGDSPVIASNGNWEIGGVDTGIQAGGQNGLTPEVGTNGNWFVGTTDTGVQAQGETGEKGAKGETGEKGDPGSKIELRINNEVWEYRYEGEEEWTPVTVNTD